MFASTKEGGRTFVVGCFVATTHDPSFERLVLAAIENHLIDEAKKTERGKLRRRLDTLLSADERFVRAAGAGGAWALRAHAGVVWQGDRDDLLRAAFAVPGTIDRRVSAVRPFTGLGPRLNLHQDRRWHVRPAPARRDPVMGGDGCGVRRGGVWVS